MQIGALEIQLIADVARLRADMDNAKSVVTAATASMKKAADDVKAAFAGMATGLSVAALIDFTKNTIDAAAKLRDLSVQAGMTVESLSGLAAVGKATGTGADMITAASNKLSKALATSNEESKGAATALKALGLSFDAFQKLTPDQRIQQVAMAMGMFNDGAQKSAAAMLLFGKSGAEMLPFLKDLAQTGQLHAKVTTEQAEAAHNFEVALGKLKTQADAWKRQLALELLPTLEAITTELLNMKAVANDPHSPSLLGEGIKTVFETIAALGVNVVYVMKAVTGELHTWGMQIDALLHLDFKGFSEIGKNWTAQAKEMRRQVDQTTYNILGITNSQAGAGRSSAAQFKDPRLLSPTVPDFHRNLTGLEGNSGADGEKQYDALIKKIKERLAAEREELTLGRQMTEEEKFETKVRADLADLMAKYPGLSKAKVEAMLAESKALDLQTLVQRNQLEQAKEIASLRQQQKNTDYAQSAQGIQDIANAYQQQLKSINDNIKSQKDDNEATQLSDQLHVSLAEAIQMVAIARLQEEQARTNEGGEAYEAIQKEIEARKELLQIVKDRSEYEKMRDLWKSIDQTAQDVFVSIFDGGSNAFKKLTEVLKSTLLKLLYEMTVQRWIVSIAASVTGNSAIGSSLTGNNLLGSLGSLGNSGGLLKNGGLIGAGYQYLTGASAGASGASLGVANGVGMMGGDSLGALIAGNGGWAGVSTAGLGALGGVTSGVSLGGIGSGIASFGVMDTGAAALSAGIGGGVAAAGGGAGLAAGAAAAIPVIGWAIAAAALLYSIFGQKSGGPKQDGRYGMLASGVAKYDRDLSPQNNAAAQQAAQGLQAQYDSIVSTFGGTGGIKYGLGFSTDPKGKSPTFLDITGSRDGQVVSNDVNLNVGRSQQELQAAIAKMGASAVLKGLTAVEHRRHHRWLSRRAGRRGHQVRRRGYCCTGALAEGGRREAKAGRDLVPAHAHRRGDPGTGQAKGTRRPGHLEPGPGGAHLRAAGRDQRAKADPGCLCRGLQRDRRHDQAHQRLRRQAQCDGRRDGLSGIAALRGAGSVLSSAWLGQVRRPRRDAEHHGLCRPVHPGADRLHRQRHGNSGRDQRGEAGSGRVAGPDERAGHRLQGRDRRFVPPERHAAGAHCQGRCQLRGADRRDHTEGGRRERRVGREGGSRCCGQGRGGSCSSGVRKHEVGRWSDYHAGRRRWFHGSRARHRPEPLRFAVRLQLLRGRCGRWGRVHQLDRERHDRVHVRRRQAARDGGVGARGGDAAGEHRRHPGCSRRGRHERPALLRSDQLAWRPAERHAAKADRRRRCRPPGHRGPALRRGGQHRPGRARGLVRAHQTQQRMSLTEDPFYRVDLIGVDAGGVPTTFRYSTQPYYSGSGGASGIPNATFVEDRVMDISYRRDMYGENSSFGDSSIAHGEIVLANADGALDGLLAYGFDAQKVEIWRVDPMNVASEVCEFRGVTEQFEMSTEEARVTIRDYAFTFSTAMQPKKFAGTNVLPNGVEGLPTDIQGKPKPICVGDVKNISPVLVNTSLLIYQFHDARPVTTMTITVFDMGVALTRGSDYTDLTDLQTNAPTPGQFRVLFDPGLNSGAFFRLGATPVGKVTADVFNPMDFGGTASEWWRCFSYVLKVGRNALQLYSEIPFISGNKAGFYFSEEITLYQALNEILQSVNGGGVHCYGATTVFIPGDIPVSVHRVSVPGATPDLVLDQTNIKNLQRITSSDQLNGLSPWRIKVGYARNYTPMSRSELAGSVSDTSVQFLNNEYRYLILDNSATLLKFPRAQEMLVNTGVTSDPTTDLAAYLQATYGSSFSLYSLTIPKRLVDDLVTVFSGVTWYGLKLQKIVSITYPRFVFAAGRNAMVIGYVMNYAANEVQLIVWVPV
jgi:hypothetical protein